MRPALQRLLGSPSALTILRDAIESPNHVFACRSCRVSPRRNQSSGSNAATNKMEGSAAAGASARIMSYITGEFRKRRQMARAEIRLALKQNLGTDERVVKVQEEHGHVVRSRKEAVPVKDQGGAFRKAAVSETESLIREHESMLINKCEVTAARKLEIDVDPLLVITSTSSRKAEERDEANSVELPKQHPANKDHGQHDSLFRKIGLKPKALIRKRYSVLEKEEDPGNLDLPKQQNPVAEQWSPGGRIRKYVLPAPPPIRKYPGRLIMEGEEEEASFVDLQDHGLRSEEGGAPVSDIQTVGAGIRPLIDNHASISDLDETEGEMRTWEPQEPQDQQPLIEENWEPSSRLQMIDPETKSFIENNSIFLGNLSREDEAEPVGSPTQTASIEEVEEASYHFRKVASEKERVIAGHGTAFEPSDIDSSTSSQDSGHHDEGATIDTLPNPQKTHRKHHVFANQVRKVSFETRLCITKFESAMQMPVMTADGITALPEEVQTRERIEQPLGRSKRQRLSPHCMTLIWDAEITHSGDLAYEDIREDVYPEIDSESSNNVNGVAVKPKRHWKTVLDTFEAYEYESDLDSDPTRGPRLIEFEQFASDMQLWVELVQFRRRHSGPRSLGTIWKQLLQRNRDLPTEGHIASDLWECFLRYGFSNHKRLSEVVSYALQLQKRTGRAWQDLYFRVMHHHLQKRDDHAFRWHDILQPHIQPTREQFISLVKYVHHSSPQSIGKLQIIYKNLPFRDLYTPVMRHLYEMEKFLAAASWHNVFIACKDLPEDLQDYRPLFRYLALFGSQKRLASMVHNMVDQQIPLPTFINLPLPRNPVSREIVDQQLAVTHGITAKTVGDDFYARLFATSWFSTDTVINILRMLGTETVGPVALRELALKERSDPRAIRARIDQMKEVGISLADSTFCKLVERLVEKENTRVLENVIECDLHPDTFDDQNLQESLLGTYHATGQQLQFDRTLAILLAKCPDKYHTTYYWNLHLRLYLKHKDLEAVVRTLQRMQASRLPIAIKSISYVRICLLARRRVGMRPRTTKELHLIVNIWQSILRSGGTMPATVWVEILKRLGMTGQLEEYEKLALWLAEWYSSSPARAYLGGLLQPPTGLTPPQLGRSTDIPRRLQSHHPNHPLYILFPKSAQQSIIAWGFQHSHIGGPGWRWGFYLLLKLKQRKVHVGRATVAKACRLRLVALFGKGRSNRLVNRRERARNAAQLEYYIQEMEKIGGKGLIRPVDRRRLSYIRLQDTDS